MKLCSAYPTLHFIVTHSMTICDALHDLVPFVQFNPLSANHTKESNTLKQFAGNLPTNCLNMFDHLGLVIKGLLLKG